MPRKHTPKKNKSGSLKPLQVVRQSGLPIEPSHLKQYSNDYAKMFDKVLAHVGVDDGTSLSEEQANRINKLLTRCDRMILRYYPVVAHWPLLSYMQYKSKIKEYGANILVSMERSTGYLCYIIMDQDAQMEKAQADAENQAAGLGYNKLK